MTRTAGEALSRALVEQDDGPVRHVAGGPLRLFAPLDYRNDQFLAWTDDRVYFSVTYDCDVWIASAPRNPVPSPQQAVGG